MKVAIYTCLVGSYDILEQPLVIHDDVEYICFSNDYHVSNVGVWQIRPIIYDSNDKTRISRFPKLNPHLVLQDYDFSVYIDSNLVIADNFFYDRIFQLISQEVSWALIKHPVSSCIYREILNCFYLMKDSSSMLCKYAEFLLNEGYPKNYGLAENNLIFRKHNSNDIIEISKLWWFMYVKFSKRDQLTLFYCFWLKDFKYDLFFLDGYSTRNHPCLKYNMHKADYNISTLSFRIKRKCKFMFNKIMYERRINKILNI